MSYFSLLLLLTSTVISGATLPATPWCSPASGTYTYTLQIKIADGTPGASIYYTTDGTTPTINSTLYTGPVSIPLAPVTETIQAIAVLNGVSSYIGGGTYTVAPFLPPPSFLPTPGSYIGNQQISITSPTPGGVIHYTTDGTPVTTSSPVYTGPITISGNASILATVAGVPGYTMSASVRGNYVVQQPTATPVISPASGTYSNPPTIVLSDSMNGAKIYYTLDGTTPTTASAVYTGPISLAATTSGATPGTKTIQAIALASGYVQSTVATSQIVLSLPTGAIATAAVSATPSLAIPPTFLGLSHEWNDAQTMMGSVSTGVNPLYTTLVGPLAQNMNGPLIIRIGGGSTDQTGLATPTTVEPFVELTQQLPVDFILGVNLGANDLSLAQEQASTFVTSMPSANLLALEIGNEPDDYGTNGYRPATYSFQNFSSDYQQWWSGLRAVNPNIGIAGPVFSSGTWDPNAGTAITSGSLQANVVMQHEYLACYNSSAPEPSNFLLQPASAQMRFGSVLPYMAAVHSANLPFRIGEMNSICTGGQRGLSNSFSSALWGIDAMFEYANAGVDGVNWNSSYMGGPYDLFLFHVWKLNSGLNGYALGGVQPLYYGLLFFSRAAGNGSSLLPVTLLTNSNLKVWATRDATGNGHITIINKEQTASGNVQITLNGFSQGTITNLSAAGGYLATNGVTFGGQTFDGSTDGTPQGTLVTHPIVPTGNVWTVSVPAMSAVLVDLQP